jgi:hypothetical protein
MSGRAAPREETDVPWGLWIMTFVIAVLVGVGVAAFKRWRMK